MSRMLESKKNLIKDYCTILLGTFIVAVGIVIFISPLRLAPGGVYGVAIIFHHLFGWRIGLTGICLEIPLLLLGIWLLGAKFGAKTIVGIISLAGFISLLELVYGYDPLISLPGNPAIADPTANFIISLFGGVIVGVGLGLIFRTRATSGGTDIIAMIVGKHVKHIPLGTILMMVDSVVVLLALVVFEDWTIPLYSWFVIYVTGFTIDKMISGFDRRKALFVISNHHEKIKEVIINEMGRGGTYFKGSGMYHEVEKKIIFTTITNKELPGLLYRIHEIDTDAFISILDATDVLGEGFNSLRERALQ
ncbi:MAG: YitT family protein [Bacteroidetes bacterium]|nr:YitT family protein [Bacteroidota bacterium]MCL2303104.1 YitT family protein [Lentimicrobiaceae bacterium]